ncbi:DUF4186 family protein [Mangrovicoccus ximenensis]|uniref:DUF4186 family protein n=1 Tax=Mangrovicoccus ximenensis TaxID=1911570 RepID=UPI001F193296|nr:DUF4186 family protein [Mangrovicoccus ximenensis]
MDLRKRSVTAGRAWWAPRRCAPNFDICDPHPVFVAQHATATCCRGCLETWHGIPKGRPLDAAEQARIAAILMLWIGRDAARRR